MAHPLDALEAYRADLAHGGRGEPFSERDTIWLAWANALQRATTLNGAERQVHLRRALTELPPPVDRHALRASTDLRTNGMLSEALADRALAIAQEAEAAGAYATATVILDLARASLEDVRELWRERLLAQQARILRRLDDSAALERRRDDIEPTAPTAVDGIAHDTEHRL